MKYFPAYFVSFTLAVAAHAGDLGGITTPLAHAPSSPLAKAFETSRVAPAPAVVTSLGTVVIGPDQVLDALTRELTARTGTEGELQLSFAQPWKNIEVRNDKDWRVVLEEVPGGFVSPSMQLVFRIEVSGQVVGTWRETVNAKLFRPVWVSLRRLDRGERLDSSVCALKRIDTLSQKLPYVPADADLSIYEMAQSLGQERPLTEQDIKLRPLVRKGDFVDVVVSEGPMSIAMKGIALGTAGAGETVGVRNRDSRKDFQARVIGPNTVQVHF
jgi:flagella basal body P-ring formation protein FlgA